MSEQVPGVTEKAMADLTVATAAGKEVTLSTGAKVVVKPLKFRQTVQTLNMLPPLLKTLEKLKEDGIDDIGLNDFLTVAPTTLENIARMSSDINPDFFESAETLDAMDVLAAVWEVNQDFFVNKLLPRLKELGLDEAFRKIRRAGSAASTS